MKHFYLKFVLYCLASYAPILLYSQDDPFEIPKYSFVNYQANQLEVFGNQKPYESLFEKFTQVGLKGEGKIRIVHIGDSHLQADFFSGYFRKRLQTFFLGAMGGRGFIFPYKAAGTNNPKNYSVTSTGYWQHYRNVDRKRDNPLGLSGIAILTEDTAASLTIRITDPKLEGYDFDRLMVFHAMGDDYFEPKIQTSAEIISMIPYPDKGYTMFEFAENITSVTLLSKKSGIEQKRFILYGINFDSNDSGVIYHTIGVNGAQIESYLSCEFFIPHLSALQPDWIIVSLGTNDVYTPLFDSLAFSQKIDSLLSMIKTASPSSAILLTAPGDHRFRMGATNKNVSVATHIMNIKAIEHQIGYWNFFQVMGGNGSVNAWHRESLVNHDYLHFTPKGYEFQGELFFNAFLKSYDRFLSYQLIKK